LKNVDNYSINQWVTEKAPQNFILQLSRVNLPKTSDDQATIGSVYMPAGAPRRPTGAGIYFPDYPGEIRRWILAIRLSLQ
jgi:hypothetical protein